MHFENITLDTVWAKDGREWLVEEKSVWKRPGHDDGVWMRKVAIGWGEVYRSEKNIEADIGRTW